jgi:hypothetical protein
MKRLILSAYIKGDDEHRQFITYCDLLKNAHAKSNDIDYFFFRCDEKVNERHFAWILIPLIRKYIDSYDQILWLDANIVISDPKQNLFEVLKMSKQFDSWKCSDPFIYCMREHSTNKPSSSVLLIDCQNKNTVNTFLNDWWNDASSDQCYSSKVSRVWSDTWPSDSEKRLQIFVGDQIPQIEDSKCPFFQLQESDKLIRTPVAKQQFYKLIAKTKTTKKIGLFMRRQNFYTNGAGQNCIFLKHALEAAGFSVDIITSDEGGVINTDIPYIFNNFTKIQISDYFLFIFGSQVPIKSYLELIRKEGVPCAMFNPANVVDGFHMENFLYNEKASSTPLFEMKFRTFCDVVWNIEPQFESSFDYLYIINRKETPILQIPHLWSPLFLFRDEKLPIYQPRLRDAKVDLIVLEPNASYCKSGWIPLVICEKFHLDHPTLVNKVYLFNAAKLTSTAKGMIDSLKLSEDKKIRLMDRMQINEILAFFADPKKNGGNHVVFVSHNINVPMNYAYYDALYSGFPLIHNSSYLVKDDIGFHYDRLFEGSDHILKSITDFDNAKYLAKSRKYLYAFDEYNPVNIEKITNLVNKTCEPTLRIID